MRCAHRDVVVGGMGVVPSLLRFSTSSIRRAPAGPSRGGASEA